MTEEKTEDKNEKRIVDEVKETITDDEVPIGKKAPKAPFALVALTYMSVLAIALLGFAILIWVFR